MKKLMLSVVGLGFGMVFGLLITTTAHAATFTVDSTADDSAVDPSVSCDTALDECTLRSAIEAANAQAGADTIEFDIAGGGVHTFTPATAYDQITTEVTIDGSTQTGASCGVFVPNRLPSANTPHTLLIEIDASNIVSGNPEALRFEGPGASDSAVRGLVINRLQQASGIVIQGDNQTDLITGLTVECNYIGTNVAGTTALAGTNPNVGVYSSFTSSLVIQNNLVSGGWGIGLIISGQSTIQNNLLGTNAAGTAALANSTGVIPANATGSPSPLVISHNIVSGNTQLGINLNGYAQIVSNYIGLGVTGSPLGNGTGIFVEGSVTGSTIGGTGAGNVISANTGNGIHITRTLVCIPATTSTAISGNYIGTNPAGVAAAGYGNQQSGIAVNETENSCGGTVFKHLIGGDGTGEQNTIAGNTLDGVRVYQVTSEQTNTDVFSITILPNNIHGNGNLGINLAADSTNSGTADVDLGPNAINSFLMDYPAPHANYYLNHPTVNSTTFAGNQITVNYDFAANQADNDPPNMTQDYVVGYRLDFYLNSAGQDGAYSGFSQGKTHLGSFIVDSSASGATHAFTSPVTPSAGQVITATATVLWTAVPEEDPCVNGQIFGPGPPFFESEGCNN